MNKLSPMAALCSLALATAAPAQSSCSSDGQARPAAVLERFISADCEACWGDAATPRARGGMLAIDWVVPGSRGEDAALSAVATRDAAARLQALARAAPAHADASLSRVGSPKQQLRVAHGFPFNGYIGTSIELQPAAGGPWTAWLLLVETLPKGTEGSPVERNLVRNALRLDWNAGTAKRLKESRSMAIPQGSDARRLRVVGWVEDGNGRVAGIAQSRCAPAN